MATIASLIVSVAADTASIDRSTKQINTQLDSISSTASKMAKGLAAAFTISAVVDAGKAVLDYAGHVTDLSARLQVSTSTIQEWEAAFAPAGVSIDVVAKSASELANKITGNDKSAVAALKAMGLSLNELKGMSPEAQFNKVADAVGNLQNNGERIYASKTLFGKGGVELLSALDGKLQENIQSFNDLGLIIDEQTIKAADDFGDQLGMMGKQLLGITASIVGPLLPALSALGNVLSWLGQNIVGPVLGGAIKVAMTLLAGFVEVVTGLLSKLANLGSNLPFVGEKFKAMGGALEDVSKRSGAYMASLWKLESGTVAAGDASAKAAPKLIGLGDAAGEVDKKAEKAAEQMRKLTAEIAKIDGGVGRGVASAVQIVGQSLDEFSRGLESGLGPSMRLVGTVINEIANRELPSFDASLGRTVSKLAGANQQLASLKRTFGDNLKSAFDGVASILDNISGKWAEFGAVVARTGQAVMSRLASGDVFGAVVAGVAGGITAISKLWTDAEKQVNPVRQAYIDAAGGLGVLNQRAMEATGSIALVQGVLNAKNPKDYSAAVEALNGALARQADIAKAASSQFGPSQTELQTLATDAKAVVDYMVASGGYSAAQQAAAYRAWQQAMADAGDGAAAAWLKSNSAAADGVAQMDKTLEGLTSKRDGLLQGIANEAPEQVMGVIESQTRGQIAALDAQISDQREKIETQANDTATAVEDAFSDVRITIPIDFTWDRPEFGGINPNPAPIDPIPQATGGDWWVTKPTLFLAGEAGPERATFTPKGKSRGESGGSGPSDAVAAEVAGLRRQQAEMNSYLQSTFARDIARAVMAARATA